jgi:predicted DNA-binding transcriptional regulator AlpA
MPIEYLTPESVCARRGITRTRLYQLIAAGLFPAASHKQGRRIFWQSDVVDAVVIEMPMKPIERKESACAGD